MLTMTIYEVFGVFIIVYYFFGSRILKMVDVLSTRVQAIYSPWEGNRQADHSALPPYILKEVARKRKEREARKIESRVTVSEVLDKTLVASKEKPWIGFPVRQKLHKGESTCNSCAPNSQQAFQVDASKERDVIDLLPVEEDSSSNFIVRTFAIVFNHLRKITNYHFPRVFESVLEDERVQDAISESTTNILSEAPEVEHTQETYKKILLSQARKAKEIVADMHAAMSNLSLMITSFLVHTVMRRCMTSVIIHPSQMEMIRQADKTKLPLIFLPLHRSHLDYILLIYILYNNGIRTPLTAAGINLKIPFFGPALRSLGAFYIKRRIEPSTGSKDVIYRATLHTYIVQCLKAGHNLKFYVEGGRTRTGKPCLPKVGLLSVILDAYMEGSVEDALLVPVSANYDKLVDGSFIRELLGEPKQKESFGSAISAIWTTMNSNHGSARVDFHKPYSLRELVQSFQSSINSPPPSLDHALTFSDFGWRGRNGIQSSASLASIHGTDVVREDQRQLVEHIATHIVYDCSSFCPIMSTNLLAFLLLNKARNGVKLGVLVDMFEKLKNDLTSNDRELGFSGESIDITNSAISLLGPGLVKRVRPDGGSEFDEVITPVTILPNVIELSYYGNALLPHYAMRSVIATSAFAMMKFKKGELLADVRLNENDLLEHSLKLCEVLQFEFVFCKPCENLETVISRTLDDMKTWGMFSSLENHMRRTYSFLDGSEEDFSDDDEAPIRHAFYSVSNDPNDLSQLRLYNMTLRPLIDTYVATVMSLHRLIGKQLPDIDFAKEVITEVKTHIDTGFCKYGESCSADSIKNASKVLKKWGVLESFTQDSINLIYLSDSFNNKKAIEDLVERIRLYKCTA